MPFRFLSSPIAANGLLRHVRKTKPFANASTPDVVLKDFRQGLGVGFSKVPG